MNHRFYLNFILKTKSYIFLKGFSFSAPGQSHKSLYSLLYTDYSILRSDVNFNMSCCALFLIYGAASHWRYQIGCSGGWYCGRPAVLSLKER
jgi:hypothetical protein